MQYGSDWQLYDLDASWSKSLCIKFDSLIMGTPQNYVGEWNQNLKEIPKNYSDVLKLVEWNWTKINMVSYI